MFSTRMLNDRSKEMREVLLEMEKENPSITARDAVSILFRRKAEEVIEEEKKRGVV